MPAVGPLDRLWRALANSIGVGTSTVARDNFDPRMLTEPIRQRLGLTIRQQVYNLITLKVYPRASAHQGLSEELSHLESDLPHASGATAANLAA